MAGGEQVKHPIKFCITMSIIALAMTLWAIDLIVTDRQRHKQLNRERVHNALMVTDALACELRQAGASNIVLRFEHGGRFGEVALPLLTNSITSWLAYRSNYVDTSAHWEFFKLEANK
jgi:hypothetical protein